MGRCDSCGIPLGAQVIRARNGRYCCDGCAAGGPCICTYEHDLGRYPPTQYAKPISLSELLDRYERDADSSVDRKARSGEDPG